MRAFQNISFSGEEPERIIYEEDSTDSYLKEDVYFMEQGEERLPLDTARVKSYLDTIRILDLNDYVNYKVSEDDLASYGLDAPELSITVDYTVTEEGTDEEKTESLVLNIARDPKERAEEEKKAEKRENQEKTDEESEEKEITAYARAGESQIVYQLSTEEYESLMDRSYDSLRHQEMFWLKMSVSWRSFWKETPTPLHPTRKRTRGFTAIRMKNWIWQTFEVP